jgi:hypothetical protein
MITSTTAELLTHISSMIILTIEEWLPHNSSTITHNGTTITHNSFIFQPPVGLSTPTDGVQEQM